MAAVYVVEMPLMVAAALNAPPPLTVQVTPALALSLATVAVNGWVAPPIMVAGLTGPMLTVIGVEV